MVSGRVEQCWSYLEEQAELKEERALTTMVPPSCHLNEFVFAQLSFNLLPFYGALRANRLKVLMTKWTNTQVFSVAWVLLIICGY